MNDTLNNTFEQDYIYSYDELIGVLKNSNEVKEKHFAALEIEEIKSQEDAQILVSNLIGQDGKVREAVAFKLKELALNPKYTSYFIDKQNFDVFLQGIMDINGNICRHIIALTEIDEFSDYLSEKLPESIKNILETISELDSNAKQYVVSKRNFQLYWCLEALHSVVSKIMLEEIKPLLFQTGVFSDYTIREKTAKILAKIDDLELNKLKLNLKSDENYYVRRY